MMEKAFRKLKTSMATALTFVLAALVTTAVGLGVVYAADPFDPDAYAAKLTMTAANGGATAINGPVRFPVYAANIADAGLLDDNGVVFTDATNAPTGGLALDLDEDEANWWIDMNIPAGEAAQTHVYMSGAESAVLFPLGDDSSIEVADADSLDITDDLVVEMTVLPTEIPAAETILIAKGEAFTLGLRPGGELFAYVASPDTTREDLRPDGTGYAAAMRRRPSGACSASWECVDDVEPDGYDTYLLTNSSSHTVFDTDAFTLEDSALSTDTEISRVEVWYRWRGPSSQSQIRPGLRLNSTNLSAPAVQRGSTTGFRTGSQMVGRPGGGDWGVADLSGLQAVIALTGGATLYGSLTQTWVRVHHEDTNPHELSGSVEAGKVFHIKLTYADPTLELYIDDVLVDSVTYGGPIHEGGSVRIGNSAFRGGIGKVRIGDTSAMSTAYALDLQMAAAHITPGTDGSSGNSWEWTGTIEDQSTPSNDATYSITYDPTNVDVTVSGVEIAPPPLVTGKVNDESPDVLGEPDVSVFTRTQPTEEAREKRGWGLFIKPVIDTAERSGLPAEAWFFSLLTVAAAVAAGRVWKHAPSYWIATGVAGTVYALGAFIFGLQLWYLLVIGISGVATVGIVDYLWSGRTHTA